MIWQLIYRTANMLRWGAGKGGDLDAEEVDKNFADLEERVWNMEENPPAAAGISNITQSGNQFTVYLSDATEFGPFTLPVASFRFLQDGWQPETGLFTWDVFVHERAGFYLVLQDHVTGDTFDPDEATTEGNVYRFLFNPFAGAASKEVAADTNGQYTLTLTDANKYLRVTEECEIIIPLNADVAFEVDTVVQFRRIDGVVTLNPADGVTINPSRPGFDPAPPWDGASFALKLVAEDEWDYIGVGTQVTA